MCHYIKLHYWNTAYHVFVLNHNVCLVNNIKKVDVKANNILI